MSFDFREWLKSLELSQYESNFKDNGVTDQSVIASVSESDLKDMGINMLGHRKKILLEAPKLKSEPATATASSTHSASKPAPPTAKSKARPNDTIDETPIPNIFKANGISSVTSYSVGTDIRAFYNPMHNNNGRYYALSYNKFYVVDKSSVKSLMEVPAPQGVDFYPDFYSFPGWGDHVAVFSTFKKGTRGPIVYDISTNDVAAKLDSFGDDRPLGMAFASDKQMLLRVYVQSQHDMMFLLDAQTGEPISKHDWGINAYNGDPAQRYIGCLQSCEGFPSVVFHTHVEKKINLIDVRSHIVKPVQIWAGVPWAPVLNISSHPYHNAHRLTISSSSGRDGGAPELWDIRMNKAMLKVDAEHAGSASTVYKNVLATCDYFTQNGEFRIWDLTKVSGTTSGAPTKVVTLPGVLGDCHPLCLFAEGRRLYGRQGVISLDGSE